MDICATPLYEILVPVSLCWILTISSVSQAIIVGPAGFVRLQVTTPHILVPSHNNSSRGSNLRSTLYMWSSSWYGLISLKFLSPQFLAKCPYLSYNQHSVSVFSSLYNWPTLAFVPRTDCSIFRNVEFNINQDAYQYVPWYHVQFRSHCIQQSMNQFSNTQRYITTAGYVELRWTSNSNKLPPTLILHLTEAKYSLSAAATVNVHSVECAKGVGWIDNSTRRTGLSYLINTVTPRNVWKAYWWNNLANTSSLRLFFSEFLSSFLFITADT